MLNLIIFLIIIAWVTGSFGNKKNKGSRTRTRNTRQKSGGSIFDTIQREFETSESMEELRQWMGGKRQKDSPYTEADEGEYTYEHADSGEGGGQNGSMQTEPDAHNMGHHMYADEVNEYVYQVEEAFTEQGMDGEVAAQGCESVADVRLVKRSKAKVEPFIAEREKLLVGLNDLPSAIVAAEILGPPKALVRMGYRRQHL